MANKMKRAYHELTDQPDPVVDKVSIDIRADNGHGYDLGDPFDPKFSSKTHKPDGRLFPNHPLYCEGFPRPKLRGMVHLMAAILLPFGWWHLYIEANHTFMGQIVASLYILANMICYGTSSLFHVGRWSLQTEIFLQKVDHCGIAILSAGTMLPTAMLLLPWRIGIPFITFTILLCIWTCIRIFQLKPSVWRQVVVAGSCLPFLPFCYYHMNRIEWFAVSMTIVFQVCGVFVFVKRQPDLIPHVFGYHELFHLLVVSAGLSVYLLNWSIIRRTCNPYDLHTDVAEVLWHMFINPNSYR